MSEVGEVSSSQTTLMFPPRSTAICGNTEPLVFVESIRGAAKVTPLSRERLKRMPREPPESVSQTTKMLPAESAATCWPEEAGESFERLAGKEKVVTRSGERR